MNAAILPGVVVYAIYKRYEPAAPIVHAALLLGVPGLLIAWLYPYSSSYMRVASMYLWYYATILSLIIAYRTSPFHPLASFPGPLPAKISKFWMSYVTARGDAHNTLRLLHARYGDVIRIGPNELSFSRSDAIQPILSMKVMRKGPYYDTRQQLEGEWTMDGLRDFAEHAARRKPWNKAMSMAALKDYSGVLEEKIRQLVNSLTQRQDQDLDISAWMCFFGFDFMGAMAFCHEFGMIESGTDVGGFLHLVERGTTISAYVSHVPWLFRILKVIPGSDRDIKKMQTLGKQCVESRLQKGSTTKDLFYYLTEQDELKSSKSIMSGESDGLLAVIAGSDTAATALAHLWYFLLRSPRYYEHLQKEIGEAFPAGYETFDFTKQDDMPYLNACINEALRLYPPVLSGLQRTVERGGHVISDNFVPGGTQVSVHMYSVQRDIREFSPLPDVYWPDRWLVQDLYTLPTGDVISKEQVVTTRGSFLPFSCGPQNCAGKSLAVMELRAVMCAMVQAFDVQVAMGFDLNSWEESIEDVYVTNRGPLMVNIKARN